MKPSDITPEKLVELDAERNDLRLKNLLRDAVVEVSRQWKMTRQLAQQMELDCMLRARRLYELGFAKKEIVNLFGVDRRTVNRWLKGMDNG